MKFRLLTLVLFICWSFAASAQNSANGLVYHGRVLKPNGDALEDANVNFTVRVYGTEALPTPKRCLLYEETHSGVNMVGSLGTFELKIGEGTRTFTPPQVGVGGIGRLFLNSPSFTLTTTSCTAGTNDFTAESLDADRELEVTIQSGATVLNLPAQKLRAMPWAMQAMEIGGYSADYLAKLNAAVPNQMNAAALMYLSNNAVVNDNGTPTNYADDTVRLQNLINPTNPQDAATKDYVDTIVGSGYSAGNGVSISAGVVSTRVDNATIEFDGSGIMRVKALGIGTSHIADGAITAVKLNQMSATTGQVLKWNGSAWAPAADDDSATVYTAGDGLALTGSDFSVNVDNTTVELNSDTLRVKDGGISFAKLNSAGGTLNEGLLVKDSSGRIFPLQCSGNQVPIWSVSNGWECVNSSSLGTVISGGTQNYLTKFNATGDNVVNSAVYESGGNVGIGTATPLSKLAVQGGVTIGSFASSIAAPANSVVISDKLGVGVSNPSYAIDVADATTASMRIMSNSSNFRLHLGADGVGGFIGTYTNPAPLRLITDGTEKMRIGINGNVGIGVTNPTAKLHLPAGTTAGSSAPLKFEPASATLMTTPENGAMEFDGTDYYLTASGTRKKIVASVSGTAGTTISGGTQNYIPKFNAAGDNIVNSAIYENSGNVGIGTASPSYQLHIQGSSNDWTKGSLYLRNTNAGAGANTNITLGNSDNIDIATFAVGSGVNPRTELTGQAGLNLIARNGGTDIRFMAGGQAAEKMRIDSTGNVGIGTTTPATKLEVGGTLKVANGSETCSVVGDGGMIRYSGTNLQFCNGSSWQTVGTGSGQVASVASTAPVKVNGGTSAQTGAVTISIDDATTSTKGIMQVGSGLSVTSGTVSASVDNSTLEINSNNLRIKDGGISYAKMNSSGATVNDGVLVKDSSGRIFNKTCVGNQFLQYSVSNGWDCVDINQVGAGTANNNTLRWNGTSWVETDGATINGTGDVTLKRAPSSDMHAATKKYVDDEITAHLIDPDAAAMALYIKNNGIPGCPSGASRSWNGTSLVCNTVSSTDFTITPTNVFGLDVPNPPAYGNCKTVTVQNTSASTSNVLSMAIIAGGSDITLSGCLDNCTGQTLAPGGTCTVGVRGYKTGAMSSTAVSLSAQIQVSASGANPATANLFGTASADPCYDGTGTIGQTCVGGAVYAGVYNSNKYMVMPSGCDMNSATPTCAGTDGYAGWAWSVNTTTDIPGVETIGSNATASTQLGDAATAAILASDPIAPYAKYCNDLVVGGYNDWYLPAKTEFAYIMCKSATVYESGSIPEEAPGCTAFGGATNQITGMQMGAYYATSTEASASTYWAYYGNSTGPWAAIGKGNNYLGVRCVRRY